MLFAAGVWLPLSMQSRLMTVDLKEAPGTAAKDDGELSFLDVMARLRPGVSMRQAQAVLGPHYRRLVTRDGDDNGAATLRVVPGGHGIVLPELRTIIERPLWALQGAVALLLLIACCNLANLLIARAAARTHEMGVRMALGAGRARLVRQLLTESLLLTALGAALALLLAAWLGPLLLRWADLNELPMDTSLNWEVFAFNAAVCAAAAVVFGLAPALAGSRLDLRSALQANRRSYTGLPRQSLGRALVVAQMAICLTVLSGAALLGRSLWNMLHQDFGFRQEGLLLASMKMDWATAFSEESGKRFAVLAPLVLEKLNALPGVQSAALSFGGPFSSDGAHGAFSVAGRQPRPEDHGSAVAVSPRYFETMGIPFLAGRAITAADSAQAPGVAVVGETAARVLFGSARPLGRYLSLSAHYQASEALQVVGVVRDVRLSASNEPAGMVIFLPLAQQPFYFSSIALRTNARAGMLAPAVRQALATVDPKLTMTSIRPVAEILDDLTSTPQMLAWLIAIFGGLALLLASAGIYGVLAYEVERRTPEISIRMALGATRSQVMGLVMNQLGRWLALGALIGAVAAAAASTAMRSLLFGITPWDSSLVAAAVVLLALVASAAAFLPARRAARLNLLDGLRQQ
ncbi:MAG TPA: FtsX-like permease family protein [Bryobacteraceae bacterium]|nr:FtsX-like permease family protein [Bryobacteraceae bacterium]